MRGVIEGQPLEIPFISGYRKGGERQESHAQDGISGMA